MEHFAVDKKVVSACHPQANGLVKLGYQLVVDARQKFSEVSMDWSRNLHKELSADRVTTQRSTARTPFNLIFGGKCVLQVDL